MFSDLTEVLKVIWFETELSEHEIAKRIGYSRGHLNTLKKKGDDSVVQLLHIAFKREIEQFVRKVKEWNAEASNSETLDQPDQNDLSKIQRGQKVIIERLERIEKALTTGNAGGSGISPAAQVKEVLRKGTSAGKGMKSKSTKASNVNFTGDKQ